MSDSSQTWVDETRWAGAGKDAVCNPVIFMATANIGETEFRAALTEYRSLDVTYPSTPWESLDVLSDDFLNWYRWERL